MKNDTQDFINERSSIRLLIRADKGVRALIERALQPVGLTCAQWLTLRLIREGIVSTPGALAAELDMNSSGATRLVDCLQERGFLRRQRSTSDRRVVGVALTEAGLRKLEQALPDGSAAWRVAWSVFTHEEGRLFERLLGKLVDAVEGGMIPPSSRDLTRLHLSSVCDGTPDIY